MSGRISRRALGKTALISSLAAVHSSRSATRVWASPNERPRIAVVGCGSRWGWQLANGGRYGVGPDFSAFGDYVAVCDADSERRDAAVRLVRDWNGATADSLLDYRDVLDRDDVDAVLVFTPDHWHAKVAVEAMRVGKDVYCEKPMTLTIEEGKLIGQVQRETGQVFQVGTQQRSDTRFLTAIAMIRDGRIGKLKRVEVGIGGAPTSPQVPAVAPPKTLDWDRWLGPVQQQDFRLLAGAKNETKAYSNCHYEFRWWYQFSGGKLTDWGAHHVDIATWGIARESGRELIVTPKEVQHPVPFENGRPTDPSRYNTATKFHFVIDDGNVLLEVKSHARNGILFEGETGRIFVNRGSLSGNPVDELKTRPLPAGALESVYGSEMRGDAPAFNSSGHVGNFFQCMKERRDPISDVHSHHFGLTQCHLMAISGRLGRELRWDTADQTIVGDEQARAMQDREKRDGYTI